MPPPDLKSMVLALKELKDHELITDEEYDKYRLQALDNWVNYQDNRSFWQKVWDKVREIGNIIHIKLVKPVIEYIDARYIEWRR